MLPVGKSLSEDVFSMARTQLTARGMKRRTGQIYTSDLGNGMLSWLGLNKHSHWNQGEIAVLPCVGVRHQALEKLVVDVAGEAFHACIPATASTTLIELMKPKHPLPWVFGQSHEANEQLMQDMVECILQYGELFWKANQTLESLARTLREGKTAFLHQTAYRLPAAYALLDQFGPARESVSDFREILKGKGSLVSDEYERWAQKFLAKLDGMEHAGH